MRRHIIKSVRGTNQYPGLGLLWKLVRYARNFYLNQQMDTSDIVRQYFAAYGTSSQPATTAATLAKLEQYKKLVIPPSADFVRHYLAPYNDKVIVVHTNAARKRLLQRLQTRKEMSVHPWMS